MNLEKQVEFITNYLKENKNSLETNVEILANVFITLGVEHMDNVPTDKIVTNAALLELLRENRKEHGETIGNALVSQGLILLTWLAS